ncbi:MAG: NAD(P)/FAD-dependent oxidoreductase [Bacteroidetes bacterium]|nr:NAD(P)/FAD-dependent oxidoreductase [Bacteroidota bacterium]
MENEKQEIAVIGGGAAGFFAAITCAENFPGHVVTIYEKGNKLLSKVRVSGGGRCNVTHACFDIKQLVGYYPRGEKQLINAFSRFGPADTVKWFEERGVELTTEDDGRMFPVTNRSETIVNCFLLEAERLKVRIVTGAELIALSKREEKFELIFQSGTHVTADKILIAAGGHPKSEHLQWLRETGHELVSSVPSLFTFNIPGNKITGLMGVSVSPVALKIEGTKMQSEGPLLITHWGMSGPAVLKMSSVAARLLAEKNYEFKLVVSWLMNDHADDLYNEISSLKNESSSKLMHAQCPFDLPKRLWNFMLQKAGIAETLRWADLSKEQMKKLTETLIHDGYDVRGKTTFKDEFVTCGGVSLNDVDFRTMESKKCKGIYFAGEVLDVDALTGGFNFQAAWTTGYLAGSNIGQ